MSTESAKVLIYDDNPDDVQFLSYLCRQNGLDVLAATTKDDAEKAVAAEPVGYAFVNYALPFVRFPQTVRVVAMGTVEATTLMQIVEYKPVSFIPKPLMLASVALGILKALGTYAEDSTYPSQIVNIHAMLRDVHSKIAAWTRVDEAAVTLLDSLRNFCHNQCPNGKKAGDIPQDEFKNYEFVAAISARGTVYCAVKNSCPLWQFHAWLQQQKEYAALPAQPVSLLTQPLEQADGAQVLDILARVVRAYDGAIHTLYEMKLNFCLHQCSCHQQGLDFKHGDTLFSSFQEMLSGTAHYCTNHSCALDFFFCLFSKKIL